MTLPKILTVISGCYTDDCQAADAVGRKTMVNGITYRSMKCGFFESVDEPLPGKKRTLFIVEELHRLDPPSESGSGSDSDADTDMPNSLHIINPPLRPGIVLLSSIGHLTTYNDVEYRVTQIFETDAGYSVGMKRTTA